MTSAELAYPARLEDAGKLALRATVGGLMLVHGVHKLLHGVGAWRRLSHRVGFQRLWRPACTSARSSRRS